MVPAHKEKSSSDQDVSIQTVLNPTSLTAIFLLNSAEARMLWTIWRWLGLGEDDE